MPADFTIDINDAHPAKRTIYSHELNVLNYLAVGFIYNGEPLSLENTNVKVNIVNEDTGIIIAEDADALISTQNTYSRLDIGQNSTFSLLPGNNLFEYRIINVNTDKVIVPNAPLIVKVTPSVLDDGVVLPEVSGTVSDCVREVIAARGGYNDLNARFDADEADMANKLDDEAGVIKTSHIDDLQVTNAKIANETIGFVKLSQTLQNTIYGKLNYVSDTTTQQQSSAIHALRSVDTIYYILIAAGVITNHSMKMAYLLNFPTSQILIFGDGAIFCSDYDNQTQTWGNWISSTNALETRVTTLETTVGTLNTQLENALNGVS